MTQHKSASYWVYVKFVIANDLKLKTWIKVDYWTEIFSITYNVMKQCRCLILWHWGSSVLNLCISIRHCRAALQEGWAELSDKPRWRGEGETATQHPSPLWQAEQRQSEPGKETCIPSCIWHHHYWSEDCVPKCLFLSDIYYLQQFCLLSALLYFYRIILLFLFQSQVYCNIVNLLLLKVNPEPARNIRYFHWYESLIQWYKNVW